MRENYSRCTKKYFFLEKERFLYSNWEAFDVENKPKSG
jgi:hypothetical protein